MRDGRARRRHPAGGIRGGREPGDDGGYHRRRVGTAGAEGAGPAQHWLPGGAGDPARLLEGGDRLGGAPAGRAAGRNGTRWPSASPATAPPPGSPTRPRLPGLSCCPAGSSDEAAAFTQLVTGVRDHQVLHLGREKAPALWSAVASAETREIGDGGRGWSRRNSESDITPIVAATLANWALGKNHRSYDIMKQSRFRLDILAG